MRQSLTSGMLLAVLCSAQGALNSLTPREAADGWLLLFDGKSLKGWEGRATSVRNRTGDWTVDNGSVVCGGKVPSWLSSDAIYSDYQLKLEFRGGEKVNSGVFLRSQKDGQPHITGYELQIWDYQPAGFLTGSLVGSQKAAPVKIQPDQARHVELRRSECALERFSKQLSDSDSALIGGGLPLDTYNPQIAKGLSSSDQTHDSRFAFSYDLPVGHGKKLNLGSRLLDTAFGEWNVAGFLTYASGVPLSVSSGLSPIGTCKQGLCHVVR